MIIRVIFFNLVLIYIFPFLLLCLETKNLDISTISMVSVSTPTLPADEIKPSSFSYFSPLSQRNPFLSPIDYEKIKIMEEEKRKEEERKREEELYNKKGSINSKRVTDPFKGIKVEGIVGNYVIINGIVLSKGKAYKKEYIIEYIGSNYVIINYKGKKKKIVIK